MTVTINGSTGVAATVIPNDGSVTQAKLAAGVAGNGPAFSAYANANQNVTNATWTKAALQVEEFDTANCFDSTTNYRFTPNVAGYYQINGAIHFQANISGQTLVGLYKNGALFKVGSQMGAMTNNDPQGVISVLVYLNGSTDYIELWGYKDSATSQGFVGAVTATYLQAFLARAA